MKYVLMLCGGGEDVDRWAALSEEENLDQFRRVGAWFAEHDAKMVEGNRLAPPSTATTVRFAADGTPMITDGPFLEGKEVIGGYAVVEVEDLDEALRMARTWPRGGRVEVRPVMEMPPEMTAAAPGEVAGSQA
jgi:hypothetical protein